MFVRARVCECLCGWVGVFMCVLLAPDHPFRDGATDIGYSSTRSIANVYVHVGDRTYVLQLACAHAYARVYIYMVYMN
jgi:hypothetical protein